MLKWVGGCVIVVVILIAGGAFFALRTMKNSLSPDGSARVAIHAPPERVFASLATADSAATYMATGSTVTTNRRGLFEPGDSVRLEMRSPFGRTTPPILWIVKEVVPGQKVVFELQSARGQAGPAIRTDSLFGKGDSTIVISRTILTLPDSAKSSSTDIMGSMVQMQSKLELENLKIRIEGRPAPRRRP